MLIRFKINFYLNAIQMLKLMISNQLLYFTLYLAINLEFGPSVCDKNLDRAPLLQRLFFYQSFLL